MQGVVMEIRVSTQLSKKILRLLGAFTEAAALPAYPQINKKSPLYEGILCISVDR